MMPGDLEQKRTHSLYLTNECTHLADELAQEWGIPRNAVFEYAIRTVHGARSALTYEIARQKAEADLRREAEEQG